MNTYVFEKNWQNVKVCCIKVTLCREERHSYSFANDDDFQTLQEGYQVRTKDQNGTYLCLQINMLDYHCEGRPYLRIPLLISSIKLTASRSHHATTYNSEPPWC